MVARLASRHASLRTLDYDHMAEVLKILAQEKPPDASLVAGRCSSPLTRLSLSLCRAEDSEAVSTVLSRLCPHLTVFSMDNSQFCPDLVSRLGGLAHLTKLELGWSCLVEATAVLHPLLAVIGGRLTHLCLENMDNCDIVALGRLCPRLVHLKLSAFLTSTVSPPDSTGSCTEAVFSLLEELYIFNSCESAIPRRVVRALLLPPGGGHLRTAYFQNLEVSWEDLLVVAAVGRLEAVSFESCPKLSVANLIQLLSVDTPLGTVHRVSHCAMCACIGRMLYDKQIDVNSISLTS